MIKLVQWLARQLKAAGRATLSGGKFILRPAGWLPALRRKLVAWRQFRQEFKLAWAQFYKLARLYFVSKQKWRAFFLISVMIAFMLAVNGVNVLSNHVQGEFSTALSEKNVPEFWRLFVEYVAVFVFSTPVVVIYQWVQDKFEISWRDWLTKDLLDKYFQNRAYYHVNHHPEIDNPDERLSDDVNNFTSTANNLFVTALSAFIALASFLGILWSISPTLLLVALGYTFIVSIFNVYIGQRLIKLNFMQRRREADFRYSLIRVRNNVESIAFYRGEKKENATIKERFLYVVTNYNLLIGWQRNMGFVKTAYDYTNTLMPSLVIAPLYFAGMVKFGIITQASDAFAQILVALSLVISQWDDLSDFISQVKRLGQFHDAISQPPVVVDAQHPLIVTDETSRRLEFDAVTVLRPNHDKPLVKDVTMVLELGQSVVIVGPSGTGKTSLLRALTKLWNAGSGIIRRPPLGEMLFLPQVPYMVLGTLRKQLLYPSIERQASDEELRKALTTVRLEHLPERFAEEGGLDAELPWEHVLSIGEQQRLSFARVLLSDRAYVILDEATSALDEKDQDTLYCLLKQRRVTYMSVGHRPSLVKHHDYVLELKSEDAWELHTAQAYQDKLDRENDEPLS